MTENESLYDEDGYMVCVYCGRKADEYFRDGEDIIPYCWNCEQESFEECIEND